MKNGYEMVDRMFEEIRNHPNHELSIESAFEFVEFYGLIDGCTLPANEGKRQFVGRCALESLNKAFANGVVFIKK